MWPKSEPLEKAFEVDEGICAMAVLPAMNPAKAAPIISDFIDFVIVTLLLEVVWVVFE
jgi:hypothetical protein